MKRPSGRSVVDQPRSSGRSLALPIPVWWPLLPILSTQAIVALATLRNTAFQDEGLYLYAGRQILRSLLGGPAPLEPYAFYFSGYPDAYPLLGGALDKIGGLELARAFSLLCMLGVTSLVFVCTNKLFSASAATYAAAAYAVLGSVLFLSRLATFDALCLLLLALATAISLHAGANHKSWLPVALGPLLALSILTKYAALLFLPSVLSLAICASVAFHGWLRMVVRFIILLLALIAALLLTYYFMDKIAFHAIAGSTTNRANIAGASRLQLFLHVLYMGAIVYAAALAGLVLVLFRQERYRMIALILFGTSWLAPAYHIYKQEPVSLDKHIAYGLFFAMPLAGYVLSRLTESTQRGLSNARRPYNLAAMAVMLVILILGLQQSQKIYYGWANTSDLSYVLHSQIRDGGGRYLVEDIEVVRYDAQDVTEPWQWNSFYYFQYVDASNRHLLGDPALAQAIKDRYFDLVELSLIYQPNDAYYTAQQMAESRNYDLIAKVAFRNSFGTGYYYIWRSALAPGQGTFTNIKQLGT